MANEQTPIGDSVIDQPERKSKILPAIAAALAFLLLIGAAGYYYWASTRPEAQITQNPPTNSGLQTPTTTPPVAENPTTTPPAEPDHYNLGDTVRLFEGDEVAIWSNGAPKYLLKANSFSDSRCPEGAQCIWAGERGVDLTLILERTDAPARNFSLKEKTSPSSTVENLNLNLITIDDDKGGTYADIKVQ